MESQQYIHDMIQPVLFDSGDKMESAQRASVPVVTVSRQFGAGGGEFACLLAERLEVECFNDQIMDYVTNRVNTDHAWQERLDEKMPNPIDNWVLSLFSKNMTIAAHQRYLVQVIHVLARLGGVIVGRGSNLILSNSQVFHLKIVGSSTACAQRVSQREQMSLDEANAKATAIDAERVHFVRALYQHCPKDVDRCDLSINSDGRTAEQMVDVALYAMRQFGYPTVS